MTKKKREEVFKERLTLLAEGANGAPLDEDYAIWALGFDALESFERAVRCVLLGPSHFPDGPLRSDLNSDTIFRISNIAAWETIDSLHAALWSRFGERWKP